MTGHTFMTRYAQPIAIGESLRLRPDPAEVHLFDPATEARVD